MVSPQDPNSDGVYNHREGDTFEQSDWRCFCTVNGELTPCCFNVGSIFMQCCNNYNLFCSMVWSS